MRVLAFESESRRRLVMAGVLLCAAICFIVLLSASFSQESLVGVAAPIIVLGFGLLALMRPGSAMTLYVITAVTTMSYQFFMLRGKSVTGGIFLSEVLLIIFLCAVLMRTAVMRKRDEGRPANPMFLPLLLLGLIPFLSVLSAYVTWDPGVSTLHRKLVVQLAGASLVFLSVSAALISSAIIRDVSQVKMVVTAMVIISASAFLDTFNLVEIGTPGKAIMFTTAPLAFSFALHAKDNWRRLFWLLFLIPPFVLAIQAIKITFLVALLVPLLVMSFVYNRRAFFITLATLFLGYLLLGAFSGRSPAVATYEKAIKMKDFDRILLFQRAVTTWKSHPFFGVGPGGQFAYLDGEHFYGTTHSLYGNFLMETGLFGILCLLWVLGAAIKLGSVTYRGAAPPGNDAPDTPDNRYIRAFVLGQTGGFLGMAVAGLFSDTLLPAIQNSGMFVFGASVHIWLLLGMTIAFRRRQLQGRTSDHPQESAASVRELKCAGQPIQ